MFSDAAYFFGLFLSALVFALLEIQIEGPAGWAKNLPTWRFHHRILHLIFPGRPLTGYHLWLLLFVAVVAHLPFAFGLTWTWRSELRAIAFVMLFWVIEDFLWFALNPAFGLAKFGPKHIAWHRHAWWWIAPRDYFIASAIGIGLYVASRQAAETIVVAVASQS